MGEWRANGCAVWQSTAHWPKTTSLSQVCVFFLNWDTKKAILALSDVDIFMVIKNWKSWVWLETTTKLKSNWIESVWHLQLSMAFQQTRPLQVGERTNEPDPAARWESVEPLLAAWLVIKMYLQTQLLLHGLKCCISATTAFSCCGGEKKQVEMDKSLSKKGSKEWQQLTFHTTRETSRA